MLLFALACGARTDPLVDDPVLRDGGFGGFDAPVAPIDGGGIRDAGRPADARPRVDAGETDAGAPDEPCALRPVFDTTTIDVGELSSGYPSVVATPDGFVAAWAHALVDYTSGLGEVLVRQYDADGRPLGDAFDAGHDGQDPYDPWLHATPHGVLLTWFEQPRGIPQRGCFRWLDDEGTPRGAATCPDELVGGRLVVSVTDDEILLVPNVVSPTVFALDVDGALTPIAMLPEQPSALGRLGDELVWLRWFETMPRRHGNVELVAATPRTVLTGVRGSSGSILRRTSDGARVLWVSNEIIVADIGSGGVYELLRIAPGTISSYHPELSSDGYLAFGMDDLAGMVAVQVEEIGSGTIARGAVAPGTGGCHPPSVGLGHDNVAVAWVGELAGAAHCTPHFAVLTCVE